MATDIYILTYNTQPPILIQRFMLNLRQFNKSEHPHTNSDAQHFSRFAVNLRVPSNFLGNIGEQLDHSQSQRLHEDEDQLEAAGAEEVKFDITNFESAQPIAGPSGTRRDEENVAGADRQDEHPAAGPSGTRRGEDIETTWGEVGDITDLSQINKIVVPNGQVCAVSQLGPWHRAESRLHHNRSSKTLQAEASISIRLATYFRARSSSGLVPRDHEVEAGLPCVSSGIFNSYPIIWSCSPHSLPLIHSRFSWIYVRSCAVLVCRLRVYTMCYSNLEVQVGIYTGHLLMIPARGSDAETPRPSFQISYSLCVHS